MSEIHRHRNYIIMNNMAHKDPIPFKTFFPICQPVIFSLLLLTGQMNFAGKVKVHWTFSNYMWSNLVVDWTLKIKYPDTAQESIRHHNSSFTVYLPLLMLM